MALEFLAARVAAASIERPAALRLYRSVRRRVARQLDLPASSRGLERDEPTVRSVDSAGGDDSAEERSRAAESPDADIASIRTSTQSWQQGLRKLRGPGILRVLAA